MHVPTLIAAEINPYLAVFLDNLFEIVGAIVLVAAIPFIRYLVLLLEEKVGFDISAEKEAQLEDVLIDGIAHAEEWARGKVVLKEDAPAGAQKMAKAIEFVEAEIKRRELDEVAKAKLEALINAKLGLTRT